MRIIYDTKNCVSYLENLLRQLIIKNASLIINNASDSLKSLRRTTESRVSW